MRGSLWIIVSLSQNAQLFIYCDSALQLMNLNLTFIYYKSKVVRAETLVLFLALLVQSTKKCFS